MLTVHVGSSKRPCADGSEAVVRRAAAAGSRHCGDVTSKLLAGHAMVVWAMISLGAVMGIAGCGGGFFGQLRRHTR